MHNDSSNSNVLGNIVREYDARMSNNININANTNVDTNVNARTKQFGINSFRNIITILMAFACAALLYSIHDEFKFTRKTSCMLGCIVSLITLCFRYDNSTSNKFKKYIITSNNTCVIGCIALLFTTVLAIEEFESSRDLIDKFIINYIPYIMFIVWTITSIYHQNCIAGILSIMALFEIFKWNFHYIVLTHYGISMIKLCSCISTSIVLNVLCICAKVHKKTYFNVFEKGITYWATVVGCTHLCALSDGHYLQKVQEVTLLTVIIVNIVSMLIFVSVIYIGNIYQVSILSPIAIISSIVLILNLQGYLYNEYIRQSMTLLLFIVVVNLYGLLCLIDRFGKSKKLQ